MKKQIFLISIILLLSSLSIFGQTVNYIPRYTNSSGAIGNSIIFQYSVSPPAPSRIGIGTTAPSTILHVNKSIPAAGMLDNNSIFRITNNYTESTGGGGIIIGTFSGGYTTAVRSVMDFEVKRSSTSLIGQVGLESGMSLGLFFKVGSIEGMRILESGNVGIGTAAPGYKLHVNSSGTTIAKFAGSYADIEIGGSSSNARIRNISNKGLEISTNNKEYQMYLAASGAVGIGTDAPEALLDISNENNQNLPFLKFTDTRTTQGSNVEIELGLAAAQGVLPAEPPVAKVGLARTGAGSNEPGLYFTTADSEKMRITKSGRIGIGTENPKAQLEVKGSNSNDTSFIASFRNYALTSSLDISIKDSETVISNSLSGDISFYTGPVEYAHMAAWLDPCKIVWTHRFKDGRLAMGVQNPNSKLHVYSSIDPDCLGRQPQSIDYSIARFEGNTTNIEINCENSNYGKIRNLSSGRGLELSTSSNSNQLCLNPNGSVSIGTVLNSTSAYKLAVEGKIACREVVIETTSWPDYVFEENYNLMSISELEKFVKTNKHLPNVAPAKEVEQSGVNMGELGTVLLEKVEELTLYTIQQQRLIEESLKRSLEQQELIEGQQELIEEQQKLIEELQSKIK